MTLTRDQLILFSDDALLHECRVESFRGSGRGGQKRNVTDSAVRVTHEATGVTAGSDETRSQIKNRQLALVLLRKQLALTLRSRQVPPNWKPEPIPGKKTSEYALWMGHLLDALAANDSAVGETARQLGVSTGRLVKLLFSDPQLWEAANQQREKRQLHRLKAPA